MLDALIVALVTLIAGLIVTGGVHVRLGDVRLELSQVDAWAWALLALVALRRVRRGAWLPPALTRASERAIRGLERHPLAILAAAIATYAALHVTISSLRFDSLNANAWDLGFV